MLALKGQTDFQKMKKLTADASKAGFWGIAFSEDLEDSGPDVFVTIAALSETCPGLGFMTDVVNQYSRHPVALGGAALSCMDLLGDRFILGLGPGSPATSKALGLESKRPLERLDEVVKIIRNISSGKEWNFDGKYFRIHGMSSLREMEYSPRIFIPGIQDKAIRFAAKFGDGIALSNFSSLGYIDHAMKTVKSVRVLKGFGASCNITYFPTNDFADGILLARPFAERFLSFPGIGETLLEHSGFDPRIAEEVRKGSLDRVTNEIIESMVVIGDKAKLVDRLKSMEKLGVEYPVVGTDPSLIEKLVNEKLE
ncbi:MAG: LLM class flavin-dependent oxidoreductase [Thaumarchaeota archaeon]|nr:LLM class flavin-dependent oxidoreductase [Nitrososphaerota archaeon]